MLADFDGTLIQGDSTKLAYRTLYSSTISFVISYYLSHFFGLLFLLFTGKDNYLRESRRLVLASRFDEIIKTNFINEAQKRIYELVYSRALDYINDGCRLVIISAGYHEIIRLIMGEHIQYEIIANSLFEKDPEVINFEEKVTRINAIVESTYFVKAAYGNTKGDIPMLELADLAFWVNENGEISKFNH